MDPYGEETPLTIAQTHLENPDAAVPPGDTVEWAAAAWCSPPGHDAGPTDGPVGGLESSRWLSRALAMLRASVSGMDSPFPAGAEPAVEIRSSRGASRRPGARNAEPLVPGPVLSYERIAHRAARRIAARVSCHATDVLLVAFGGRAYDRIRPDLEDSVEDLALEAQRRAARDPHRPLFAVVHAYEVMYRSATAKDGDEAPRARRPGHAFLASAHLSRQPGCVDHTKEVRSPRMTRVEQHRIRSVLLYAGRPGPRR